jgi:hypothetical protein
MNAAWAGTTEQFLETPESTLLEALEARHADGMGMPAATSQLEAWREELQILEAALSNCIRERESARYWGVILEYELPLEGGRRPDAVILTGSSLAVLEFKQASFPTRAFVDQTWSYARDIAEYHAASHGRMVLPILVLTASRGIAVDFDPVVITGQDELGHYLLENEIQADTPVPMDTWLNAPYEPLPTLVAAARRIFEHEPLPHVRTALAQDIPGTVRRIHELAQEAATEGRRKLVLLTGVPGSGKTLVGLRLVYEATGKSARGLLLSGNGPLVAVLQDALKSRVFVRDLHAFIKTYAQAGMMPSERIIVFDEAQRAWDADYMRYKRGIPFSEPELLVDITGRIPDWVVLVGLVGEGQEIFSGEEGGIEAWRQAIARQDNWTVHAPPHLAGEFAGWCRVQAEEKLELKVSIRSRRAELLHEWVDRLLAGSLDLAAKVADHLWDRDVTFPVFVTRELEEAKRYVRLRYEGEPDKRYGLITKAYAKSVRKYGVDNHFQAQQKLQLGRWFNAPAR